MEMAFGKENSAARKDWVAGIPKSWFVDYSVNNLSYSDFVDKELVQFCRYVSAILPSFSLLGNNKVYRAANIRAIPSVVDGLKPGQRKVT